MPNTHTTLASLFTAIANAIRTKKGTSAKIVADNFPEEIDSIGADNGTLLTIINRSISGVLDLSIFDTETASSLNMIGDNAFRNCASLTAVKFGKFHKSGETSMIRSNVFQGCAHIALYDFSNYIGTVVPTLTATNAFSGTSDYKIVVPISLYSQWTTATNWNSLLSHIVPAEEIQ